MLDRSSSSSTRIVAWRGMIGSSAFDVVAKDSAETIVANASEVLMMREVEVVEVEGEM